MKPVALITGGAKRVGNVIARELASRGYRLIVHANTSIEEAEQFAAELAASGHEAHALQANLRDPAAIEQMVDDAVRPFGRIDALINSAAIWKSKPLEATSAADVREHFEINTLGTYLCCQHVGLRMCGQPAGGSIVNLGDWAIARPYVDYPAYFPSKGAIPTLTRTFAVELARRNPAVRVNAVLPGPVMLPPDLPAAERQAAIDGTLLRREGSPQNIAHAVAFLLENDFITGVCLPVDGGRTIFSGSFER
jgi:pteridine reductase